jgi:hypothetical protein
MEPLGLHGTVEYGDQHDSFGRLLPRAGAITRQIELADSALAWYLFTLDEPFEWEGQYVDHFIIAARWIGHPIGGPDFTSLFVLLDPQHRVEAGDRLRMADLTQICWAQFVCAHAKT